jgi:apolipoprotein N-acyltransferase
MERWVDSNWRLPVLSGTLLAAAYILPLLVPNFIAFIPLLYWLERRGGAGPYDRIKAGILFGLVTYLIGLSFMPVAMTRISWLAIPLYLGFALALALRVAISVSLLGWLRRTTGLSWGLLLPICWLPFEWIQTFGDLRMTGEHIANSLACHPFVVQFADLLGPYGVGAFMLAVNGLLYDCMIHWGKPIGRKSGVALALLLAAVLGYDGWRWFMPPPPESPLRIAIIQPNIPLAVKMDPATAVEQWRTLEKLSRQASYAKVRGSRDFDLYNAAVAVDSAGELNPVWTAKVYLVPFVEATPFRRLLGPLVEDREGEWRWLSGGFAQGPRYTLLDVDGTAVGVLVCYEQLFAELARGLRNAGAEFQVVVTNDAWFGRTFFQTYQANVLRLRAIENRSAFVRVANTGISGFVDTLGRYHQLTPLFDSAVEVRSIQRTSGRTVYSRLGDAIIWPVLLGLLCAVVAARR